MDQMLISMYKGMFQMIPSPNIYVREQLRKNIIEQDTVSSRAYAFNLNLSRILLALVGINEPQKERVLATETTANCTRKCNTTMYYSNDTIVVNRSASGYSEEFDVDNGSPALFNHANFSTAMFTNFSIIQNLMLFCLAWW